jgi:hypothetical protein
VAVAAQSAIRTPHSAIDCRRRHGTMHPVNVWGAHPVAEVTHPAVGGGQRELSKHGVHAARAWFRNTVRVPDGGSRWRAASWPLAPSAGPDKRFNREASRIPECPSVRRERVQRATSRRAKEVAQMFGRGICKGGCG